VLSDHSNVLPVNTFFYFIFFCIFLAFCFIGVLYFPCPHSFKKKKKKGKKQHNPVLAVVIVILVFTYGDGWVLGTYGKCPSESGTKFQDLGKKQAALSP
jgi:hypothetical protein